jgi:hypothetical protein
MQRLLAKHGGGDDGPVIVLDPSEALIGFGEAEEGGAAGARARALRDGGSLLDSTVAAARLQQSDAAGRGHGQSSVGVQEALDTSMADKQQKMSWRERALQARAAKAAAEPPPQPAAAIDVPEAVAEPTLAAGQGGGGAGLGVGTGMVLQMNWRDKAKARGRGAAAG